LENLMSTPVALPITTAFDTLPILDLAAADITSEGNRRLATLRAAGALCQVQPIGALGLLRWADCDRVLRDATTFSAAFARSKPVPGAEAETTFDVLLRQDPPEHTRVRGLVQQAFTPQRVAAMEPHTREIVRGLLDEIMARGDRCEFQHDFALPLPSHVMSGLLGVDPSMMDTFQHWANSVFAGPPLAWQIRDSSERDRRLAAIAQDAHDMEAYLKELVAETRNSPTRTLTSYVIQAQQGGQSLSEREILTLMKLFVIAGNDITTMSIGLTIHCLATHPDQMRLLSDNPSLAANAYEEVLRFQGPVMALQRMTTREVEIAGLTVPAGTLVAPIVSSANHDEAVFDNPETFDIRRKIPRILSLGSGVHQCLGQLLGRLEARVALEEWFTRVSAFAEVGQPTFVTMIGGRGFASLPVTFTRRPSPAAGVPPQESGVRVVATADRVAHKSDAELGLLKRAMATVKVAQIRSVSPTVKMFKLIHPSGGLLERFTPGSHIVIHMRDGDHVYRNAYSLLNAGYGDGLCYFVAIQRARDSKGGSIYMHDQVERGSELTISVPANNFAVADHATKHLLIGGGIGITPMVAFRYALKLRGERFELHYTFANSETAAFVDDFQFENDSNDVLYDSSLGQKLDIPSLVRRQPEGTHVYVCGPEGLMTQTIEVAENLGWPSDSIHFERFGAPILKGDAPFDIIATRSGETVHVGGNETALDALERAGIQVQSACRAGSCGSCQTRVMSGTIIPRDSILTPAEHAAGDEMMVCVSRGDGTLTLDV
jgi:cytochrome P450/ferredoxin-NADP reductase